MKLITTAIIATGDVQNMIVPKGKTFVPVQASSTTSTVVIQGRFGADHDWVDLVTLTDSAADTVAVFPQMRADVTAVTGTCEVDINTSGKPA